MKEFQITGAPGTGKTSFIASQAKVAARKYGSSGVMILSLTRAAAAEVAGRETTIPAKNIGTLHSICFRALDRKEIADLHLDEFSQEVPEYALSAEHKRKAGEEIDIQAPAYGCVGDELAARYQLHRQRLTPRELWEPSVSGFAERYEAWKRESDYLDFTDMIELALRDLDHAPGSPDVIFGDECQDWSALEAALMRKWGNAADWFVLVGDPDQSIYAWRGADPDIFRRAELPPEHRKTLPKSFRLPAVIHAAARQWIKRIGDRRTDADFEPREAGGVVRRIGASLAYPSMILDEIESQLDAGDDPDVKPRTFMVIASCSFMVDQFKHGLRERAIPFHNPYRRSRGDWNPIRVGGEKKSPATRLLAYLRPSEDVHAWEARDWDVPDLVAWLDHVRAKGVLRGGAKTDLEAWTELGVEELDDDDMQGLFADPTVFAAAYGAAKRGDPDWFAGSLRASHSAKYDYVIDVLKRRGVGGLTAVPQVVIGTVHSVKGGEADTVYVAPDLSYAGIRGYVGNEADRDAIIRLFYVAMTRARDELVICEPSTRFYVPEFYDIGAAG